MDANELVRFLDVADKDWRRILRSNLSGEEQLLHAVHDIAFECRLLREAIAAQRPDAERQCLDCTPTVHPA